MPGEHGTSCGCISSVEDLGAEDLLKFIDVDHVIGYNESVRIIYFILYLDSLINEECVSSLRG